MIYGTTLAPILLPHLPESPSTSMIHTHIHCPLRRIIVLYGTPQNDMFWRVLETSTEKVLKTLIVRRSDAPSYDIRNGPTTVHFFLLRMASKERTNFTHDDCDPSRPEVT